MRVQGRGPAPGGKTQAAASSALQLQRPRRRQRPSPQQHPLPRRDGAAGTQRAQCAVADSKLQAALKTERDESLAARKEAKSKAKRKRKAAVQAEREASAAAAVSRATSPHDTAAAPSRGNGIEQASAVLSFTAQYEIGVGAAKPVGIVCAAETGAAEAVLSAFGFDRASAAPGGASPPTSGATATPTEVRYEVDEGTAERAAYTWPKVQMQAGAGVDVRYGSGIEQLSRAIKAAPRRAARASQLELRIENQSETGWAHLANLLQKLPRFRRLAVPLSRTQLSRSLSAAIWTVVSGNAAKSITELQLINCSLKSSSRVSAIDALQLR